MNDGGILMQRYFAKQKTENYLILEESDLYHIKTVMRMDEHDKIQVIYENKVYLCCLENVKKNIQIKVEKELEVSENKMPKITLIIPLLKEQKMDFILQKATELGVDTIIPIETERSIIKRKEEKEEKKLERWKRICKEASEQSYRMDIPTILPIQNPKKMNTLQGLNLICSTRETQKNIRFILNSNPTCDRINIVIGPEGGFSEVEETLWNNLGFLSVSLGNRIMRVETVPLYLLSVLNFYYME